MQRNDVLCFSHLRWNFVFQRPNHLMSRCARDHKVLFIEEPMFDVAEATTELVVVAPNLWRLIPHLPPGRPDEEGHTHTRAMIVRCSAELGIERPIHWFYTPMMLPIARGLPASLTVYDCMDELSHFAFAPASLPALEAELMERAALMFTGGMALYEAKRHRHPNVHGVPSSVDTAFFAEGRDDGAAPADLAGIARPRLGYCGVIDERIDLGLVAAIAHARPAWQLVMIGPTAKLEPGALPQAPNIHYLGGKPYGELPRYLGSLDVGLMPFALNDATRFISPTKTPEYLAAGLPVVSTAIRDVVEPYGRLGLVHIAADAPAFIDRLCAILERGEIGDTAARDAFLAAISWDATWQRMAALMRQALTARQHGSTHPSAPRSTETQHV